MLNYALQHPLAVLVFTVSVAIGSSFLRWLEGRWK